MPWKEHFPQKGAAPKAPCRFGVSGYSRSAKLAAKVAIATVTLQEELGWHKGDFIRAFIGEGDHAGQIRLEKSAAGGFKVGLMRGTMLINLGMLPGIAAEAHAMTPVEYRTQGSAIMITLPPWAIRRADTAPPEVTARREPTPAQIRAAQAKVNSRPIGRIAT